MGVGKLLDLVFFFGGETRLICTYIVTSGDSILCYASDCTVTEEKLGMWADEEH